MQRRSPASGTAAKQLIDAVNGSSGGQHLDNHVARRKFLFKAVPADETSQLVIELRPPVLVIVDLADGQTVIRPR